MLSGVGAPFGPLTPFRVGGVSQLTSFLQKRLKAQQSEDGNKSEGGEGDKYDKDHHIHHYHHVGKDDDDGLTCVCIPVG